MYHLRNAPRSLENLSFGYWYQSVIKELQLKMIAYRFGDSSVKRGYSPKWRRAFEICHPIRAGDLASFLALRPLSSEKRIKKNGGGDSLSVMSSYFVMVSPPNVRLAPSLVILRKGLKFKAEVCLVGTRLSNHAP